MAYFRSDENFLYFNPTVQYAPWKSLNSGLLFSGYATVAAAEQPY